MNIEEELLRWAIFEAKWTMWLSIGTFIMAFAIGLTAYFSIKTWRDSVRKDREKAAVLLLKEFLDSNSHKVFLTLSQNVYHSGPDVQTVFNDVGIRPEGFIKNYFRISKFYKKKKLTFEELEFYFDRYLFVPEEFMNLLKNIKTLELKFDKKDFDNLNFLIKRIGKKRGFLEYKKAIRDNLNINYKKTFRRTIYTR